MRTAVNRGGRFFLSLGEALQADYNSVANVVKRVAFRK